MNMTWKQLMQWPPTATTVIGIGLIVGVATYLLTGSVTLAFFLAGLFKTICPQDAASVDELGPLLQKLPQQLGGASKALALIVCAGALSGLAACTSPPPISTNPVQSAVNLVAPGGADVVTQGITNAQYNFNEAVKLGILPATDPAPQCLNSVAALMGIGGTAPPSFTPKVTDLISAGSVGYIYIQQLKTATGGTLTVSPGCEQLIGQIILDATRAGLKAGAGALSVGALSGGIPLPIPLPPIAASAPPREGQ